MMRRVWELSPVRFVREIVGVYFDKHVSRSAAELAYFLILSFFPLLICVNAFVGLLQINIDSAIAALDSVLPDMAVSVLIDYLQYIGENESAALLAAGIVTTLISASAAMRALMNIMDDIYGRASYHGIWRLIVSILFSLLFLATIYLSMVVLLTGKWFFEFLGRYFRFTRIVADWQWLRFLILFALVLLFVLLLYRMSAPRGPTRAPVLTGALLAALALVAASIIFSWFIGMSSNYSLVYGSLASLIIMLTWLYLCGNILILGNVFNAVWYARKKARGTIG